jgi:hypothetical protein
MKFIPIRVDMINRKYSFIFPEFSSFLSHVTDCINTSNTPIFRIFFIRTLVPEEIYMPPKSDPSVEGRNPMIVITAKSNTEKRIILFFLSGSQNISAINTERAATISSIS